MTRSSLYTNADASLAGQLDSKLTEWRGSGLTFAEIAYKLRDADITVSHETVRVWCTRIGIHAPSGDAA